MQSWGYVFLCLLLPVAWGIVSAHLFDWLQARRHAAAPALSQTHHVSSGEVDDEMYYI